MASKPNVTFFLLFVTFTFVKTQNISLFDKTTEGLLGSTKGFSLNFTERSARFGFESDEHKVSTEDGYILTFFRMRKKNCGELKRTPVILWHGLIQTSNHWLDAGLNASLAYLIAGECHDLWLGNDRGNYYSRAHVRLNPDKDSKFWDYSVDEIGRYDVPATIDYVLKYTGEDKVNFICYSQSGTTLLILCSERPGYCESKVNVFLGLAPSVKISNMKSTVVRVFLESLIRLKGILTTLGINEVLAKGGVTHDFIGLVCLLRPAANIICGTGAGFLDSSHPGSVTGETWQMVSRHTPAGTSLRTLLHYSQIFKTDKFEKYDFGKARNLEVYGTEQPPTYNLANVTVPVVLLHGSNDHFIDENNMLWLQQELQNVLETYKVTDPLWNHIDMAYSQHINPMIFPKVNEYLLKYNKQ
ncbi:lipase 3-like [Bicyclus anynana]|uniref:Lipase n=1 Tax=Bicyclus anynana TaxID=110368 RepID=A0A6J1NKH1_BICAN|nr:lipase 3-like [Bicyclus anynana]